MITGRASVVRLLTHSDGRWRDGSSDSHESASGRRSGDPLLRRGADPRATRVDSRDLPPVATHSQLRFDALLGEWVAIASHRQTRTFLPPADECPLCPSRAGPPAEIPDTDYEVVVFENRFPSFATGVARDVPPHAPGAPTGRAAPRVRPLRGRLLHQRPRRRLRRARPRAGPPVVDAWADRTAELAALDGVEQVFCFENRGEEIGVTLSHPHGQIYAYPFVTPRAEKMLDVGPAPPRATGGNLFADVLAAEREPGPRVVAATSTGRRSCRRPPAGRTRCISTRTGRCPTSRRSTTPSGTPSSTSTWTCCAASTRLFDTPCPTSPPGTRRRARDRDLAICTCSCSRSAAPRAS